MKLASVIELAVADLACPAELVVTHDSNPGEDGWTEGNTWNAGSSTDWPHLRPSAHHTEARENQQASYDKSADDAGGFLGR